jgi:hypothetical protein
MAAKLTRRELVSQLLIGAVLMLVFPSNATQAQYTIPSNRVGPPVTGSTAQTQVEKNSFAIGLQGGPNVHRDGAGRNCINVSASSTPMISNPNTFTHLLTAANGCQVPIKMSVCYYGSSQCQLVLVPGFSRKAIVLGVYPSLKDFRYQYTEQF